MSCLNQERREREERKQGRGRRDGRKTQPGYLSVILALQRLGQEDYEFKGSLTDIKKGEKNKERRNGNGRERKETEDKGETLKSPCRDGQCYFWISNVPQRLYEHLT